MMSWWAEATVSCLTGSNWAWFWFGLWPPLSPVPGSLFTATAAEAMTGAVELRVTVIELGVEVGGWAVSPRPGGAAGGVISAPGGAVVGSYSISNYVLLRRGQAFTVEGWGASTAQEATQRELRTHRVQVY